MFGQSVKVNPWALGDFARHFPDVMPWNHRNWDLFVEGMNITAYNATSGVKLTFEGDGVIRAERGDVWHVFDDHSTANRGEGAFVRWVEKKFPDVRL